MTSWPIFIDTIGQIETDGKITISAALRISIIGRVVLAAEIKASETNSASLQPRTPSNFISFVWTNSELTNPMNMGAGATKKLKIVQPQTNVAELSSSPESLMQKAVKRKVFPEQWSSHVRPGEDESSKTNSIEDDIEWCLLHLGTLERYKTNYPDQAGDLQKVFENIQVLQNTFANNSRGRDQYPKLTGPTGNLNTTSCNIASSAGTSRAQEYIRIVDFVVEIDGAAVLQKFAQNCFNDYYEMGDESDDESRGDILWDFTCFACLHQVLGSMHNITDFHDGFCSAIAKAGVVPMCLENIIRLDKENGKWQNGDEESEQLRVIETCLAILHNISRRLRDRELFANSEKTLPYFAKVSKTGIATLALLCLGYLVNEETNHLISADENLLLSIVKMLNEACQSEDRHYDGFSAKELAEGLSHLAINDDNKKILGKNGAIRVRTSILQTSNDDEERASAARALWMLAFDDSNKGVIRQEKGALDTLRALHHSRNPEVQKAAAGALWEMKGKTARNNTEKGKEAIGNHVMISYQWDAQEVLVEVKNKLQASGYRVWMDLEQMGGSTLDTMAKAVEDAAVVLVCVSQRYKESLNCRSEAEYAYQLRKDIIPLMMQRNYQADGWLGMLVGTKLWIDLQRKQIVDSAVGKLIKELGGRGKDGHATDGSPEGVIRPSEISVVTAPRPGTDVSGWTNQDVKKWLSEIGLGQVCKKTISEFNGQTLIDLQELRGECPEVFYKGVGNTLNLKNIFHLLKFKRELHKLLSQ